MTTKKTKALAAKLQGGCEAVRYLAVRTKLRAGDAINHEVHSDDVINHEIHSDGVVAPLPH